MNGVGYHYHIIPQLGKTNAPCNSGSGFHFPQLSSMAIYGHAYWGERRILRAMAILQNRVKI